MGSTKKSQSEHNAQKGKRDNVDIRQNPDDGIENVTGNDHIKNKGTKVQQNAANHAGRDDLIERNQERKM